MAALLIACANPQRPQAPETSIIATEEPAITPPSADSQPAFTDGFPSPTATPKLAPAELPTVYAAEVEASSARPLSSFSWDNDPTCEASPDRYAWEQYALAAGFPPEVVASDEMQELIRAESHGDLCAVNDSSGATCWIQQFPGSPDFLDPTRCMAQGYAKWAPTRSFYDHWYRFWGR